MAAESIAADFAVDTPAVVVGKDAVAEETVAVAVADMGRSLVEEQKDRKEPHRPSAVAQEEGS